MSDYSQKPSIYVSPNLTKILIIGQVNNTNSSSYLRADYWYLNYSSDSYKNMSFPLEGVVDLTSTFIILEEDWIYVRQLMRNSQNQNNTINNSINATIRGPPLTTHKQYVYLIK